MMSKQTNQSIKICFVALTAYPLLSGGNNRNVIGPDVHQVILAKELIKHDFKITFITYNEGGEPVEYINGMEIIKIHEDAYRLRILYIVSKVFRIWNAMRKANAHIYIHTGGVTTSLFCRLTRKKFVCDIASDALVNRDLVTKRIRGFSQSKFSFGTFGNWLDIKLADSLIVQNKYQETMLNKNFGKDSFLIKMPFPLIEQGTPEKANPPIVLWVGAMAEVKQPELFVRLAEAIPEARFQMIGGHSGNQEFYDRIKEKSKRIPNFEFLGVIPFNDVDEYFSRASILVNTSMFEGFPHAFIQAWMHYIPIVSLHSDPDEIICRHNMGFHSKTFQQLVEDVKTLLKNKALGEEMGVNGRKYVEREHDIKKIIEKYIELFNSIGEH
ncbi:MAG: Glycosyl transferases group 1 [Candidatus Argoarchaeum ethanivorans]|uniref:Glycosyl transferases group 1 n=1 Tax=Candidatus Argoarchaeum ethanivorans TaxID=2608793 RepID=A0A811T311_9EURY|nr:MAG: Glycosyl transferases group 1 [Candidatus Argoarchaeum ethanivorans]